MTVRILPGDCRDVLATLPDESVHCVVTSPPYWGLRDYGTSMWEGGDATCDHKRKSQAEPKLYTDGSGNLNRSNTNWDNRHEPLHDDICGKCGARRIDSQLGLEQSLGEHVEAMVGVFREVRRVLRKDGTLWLNYGDSYAGGNGIGRNDAGRDFTGGGGNIAGSGNPGKQGNHDRVTGLKPKDLCGIPWRVAFALQADGWYLRQDIIWSKPNPMPESVRDRCTKAHEYLFLLSKSERYYYDQDAIREPQSEGTFERYKEGENIPTFRKSGGSDRKTQQFADATPLAILPNGRNKRSVWEIATAPFSEAHFATFPPALIEPCIKAGTSEKGCCSACGAPWVRETEKSEPIGRRDNGDGDRFVDLEMSTGRAGSRSITTRGWSPSCFCNILPQIIPCTVLDPFGGAGTTGLVADRLQRSAILIELNPQYAAMADRRIRQDAGLFHEAAE